MMLFLDIWLHANVNRAKIDFQIVEIDKRMIHLQITRCDLNMNILSYQYMDPHYKAKTVIIFMM